MVCLPTQIGVPTYGAGLVINQLEINWPKINLIPMQKIYPGDLIFNGKRDYAGVHTLNFSEHYTVVDVKWYGFNAVDTLFRAYRKIRGKNQYDGKR